MSRRVIAAIALLPLAACTLAPHDVRPDPPIPPSWPTGDAYLVRSEAPLPSVSYREIFRDARLQALISLALANNRDLRLAAANVAAARAQFRIQKAELLPEVDAGASYQHSYQGGKGAGAANGGAGPGASDMFSATLAVPAYELDLFGRVRSLTAAARDRYFGQEATARATRLALVGSLAQAWLTYAEDASLIALARQTAASAGASVAVTTARVRRGVAPETDLDQARETLHTANADLAEATTALAQDRNQLRLLAGADVPPDLLPASLDDAARGIAELPAGLDSRILLRRPDVVRAEFDLRAANAEIGAARAQLFPRIALTAMAGFASQALSSLFSGGAFSWSAGAGATYPIFRAGAGRAGVRYAEAGRDAALATYEKTIQTAFSEVADALARRGTIDAELRERTALVADTGHTLTISDARYRAGVDPYLSNLDARRSLYAAQKALVATQYVRAGNLVTLYQVLGGDALLAADAPDSGLPR